MSFTQLSSTQNAFLESHLRGTSRTLSAKQALATYGIQNLRARISELRSVGLKVNTGINSTGQTTYGISSRDVTGSRAARLV